MATTYRDVKRLKASELLLEARRTGTVELIPHFAVYHEDFYGIIGAEPELRLELEDDWQFAHEAGVYFPKDDCIFITSNHISDVATSKTTIAISKLTRSADARWRKETVDTDVVLGNGGINYQTDVLFCAQGDDKRPSGLMVMSTSAPYHSRYLINSYHGRQFNSINDVVIKSDGSIWFTDPIYGFEQGIRPPPELPSQVYRFHAETGDIRAVADGFGRPNGLAFSPDEQTLYVTDTEWIHGDGSTSDSRASSIYAFDVIERSAGSFLANRRLFAMADCQIPDGIKCDMEGNVYSGCGDGVNVWSPGGSLLGKIVVPGGVANFCFARSGELLLLNETRFWSARISKTVQGALLNAQGIDCDS